jgi:branched-chain amino acid transport system substrate-binding protein
MTIVDLISFNLKREGFEIDAAYDGVSGHIEFDQENGDAIRNAAFVKVADTESGAWNFVSEQTVSE